jgi:2-iminoacetate synthase ThiH
MSIKSMTEWVAKLRDLQEETIKQTSIMPIVYDLETDIRFMQGEARGEARGEEKTTVTAIKELLLSKLLTSQQIADVFKVPLERVEQIKKML